MGSFGDGNYSKSDNPALSWVQKGIDKYNAATHNRLLAAPFWLKFLLLCGISGPIYKWQAKEPLWPYYPKDDK